ncbi:MAG: hypothetical protein HPZ91_13925 [Lentisphaeria bacterium]|nr:hypothetical protein [Lentisphaeria bacterium]
MMQHLRTSAMIAAFILGYVCPWASSLNWLIRWLIVAMMFLVFLQVKVTWRAVRLAHLKILAANVAIGMGCWFLFRLFGSDELAQAAFFTGITPTATAAAVIIHLLGGRVDFAVSAFLATNFGMAVLFPFLIPVVIGNPAPGVFMEVVKSLLVVIGVPLAAAIPVRLLYKHATELPKKLRNVSFFLWVGAIFLIIANASAYLHSQAHLSKTVLAEVAAISLGICIFNFWVGQFLGGKRFRREASQVLGQKNTTLTIYLALAYANPLVALGPTFYVLWHNGWNTWQLHMYGRRKHLRESKRKNGAS